MAASQGVDAPPNAGLLANIRPGSSLADLKAAIGGRWRDLAPHRGGVVDILENTHGFKARLDTAGLVGSVDYNYRFPRDVEIAGLRMNMSLTDAAAARPDLQLSPDHRKYRFGTLDMPDGVSLRVEFTLDTINEVKIGDPKAVYPTISSPPYPAIAGAPGSPFKDANLKLVVLAALLTAKEIDLGEPSQLAEHVLGRKFEASDGYEIMPEALDYLARYPLDDDLLRRVETLFFDGGIPIYSFIWPGRMGEYDDFDVKSFEGIEYCQNLTTIDVNSMVKSVDLNSLIGLRELRDVQIGVDFTNLAALLEMPKLEVVKFMGDDIYAEVMTEGSAARRVMEALKRRGVKVWVHWISHSGPGRPPPYR